MWVLAQASYENRMVCIMISLEDEVFIELHLSQFPCFKMGLSFFVWCAVLDGYPQKQYFSLSIFSIVGPLNNI